MAMTLLFYGTRGAIMAASRERLIYGGHTSCVTLSEGNDTLIIDAGFGIANLSAELGAKLPLAKGGHTFHILLTHFHWDHIQGLQYFSPIYFKGNRVNVYTPFPVEVVQDVMNLLLDGSYTPFDGLLSLPCEWRFHQLEGITRIGELSVAFHPTAHVGECYAYRVSGEAGRVSYVTDHDGAPSAVNESLIKWAQGSDILIHEATFTPGEYQRNPDLGHSSFISALQNAQLVGAPLTLLTHNHALRSDSELSEHERYLEHLYNTRERRIAFARETIPYRIGGVTDPSLIPT